MIGSALIQLIFSIYDMVIGFSNIMFKMVTMNLGQLLAASDVQESKIFPFLDMELMRKAVLGDLYDMSLITIFGGSGLLVLIGLLIIKKFVPLA